MPTSEACEPRAPEPNGCPITLAAEPIGSSTKPRRFLPEIIAGMAVVAIFGLPSLAFPFGIDQGQQDAIGRLMADGLVLYRDIWDNRSPLLYVMAALGHLVGLNGMMGLRVADLLYQTATAGLLALLVMRTTSLRGAGFLAAAFYGWTYYGQSHNLSTCQPDGRLALFIVGALLLLEGSKS
ncbi:MAG: hypothetical protein LBM75_05570, partial [Myxococcales bacterium]|nr:hypothetical protein [Myxococcales bacterium]